MRARSYRHTVDIQTVTESTADAYGGTTKTWATVETVQAAVTPLSGNELTIARQASERVTHRVEMHYMATVVPRARLKYGDRVLNVESVLNTEERDRQLVVMCAEVV